MNSKSTPITASVIEDPRITLVVQGRFHAFALAKALIEQHASVHVITNYPVFLAERFGLPREHVSGFGLMGLLHRYAYQLDLVRRIPALEKLLHVGFSQWATRHILINNPNVVHSFSGVSLEIYQNLQARGSNVKRILARGSGHIRSQYHDLFRESQRAGADIDMPSAWMIRREMKEYALAHKIITLSSFAEESFIRLGYSKDKMLMLPLGADVKQFRPARAVIDARLSRIRSGQKLKVLYTGNISLQKGIIDMIEIAKALRGKIHFRLVGNITPDAVKRIKAADDLFELVPRQPEGQLPAIYNDADIFVFPTIHDGFAAVLAQARAACLPILATNHCSAADMIQEGKNGWTFPVRRADQIIERLEWCDLHREETARLVEYLWEQQDTRDWQNVATDFLNLVYRPKVATT